MPPRSPSLPPVPGGHAPTREEPEDVQSRPAPRPLPLAAAGVRGLRLPTRLLLPDRTAATVATYDLAVALGTDRKGVHMSRLVACAHAWSAGFDPLRPRALLADLRATQPAPAAEFTVRFPYHREKSAPVTGERGMMEYGVVLVGRADPVRPERFVLALEVPVTTLCPCSRDISEHGAHNQRAWARVRFRLDPEGTPETLDGLLTRVEREGSSELYAVLKRPDEKHVTERAYANPKFSEDLARDLAHALGGLPGLRLLTVDVENLESIHAHSAFARYENPSFVPEPVVSPAEG